MYENFFEMLHTPFTRDIPAELLYESPYVADAIGRLTYAADRQLFAVVTADAGCGKSTLIRRFVDSLPKDDAKRQLQNQIEIIRGVQNKKVICILDEAHLLEKETIEEFRFLLNYRFDSMSPMALVLVGQTELWDKLKLQRYAAVRQRIDINCVLPHLDRSETEQYIQSHLKYADGRQDLFTDKALDDIYRESAGIPRSINRISEKCLMYGFQQNKRLIDEHMVRYVVDHEMLKGGADS